MDNIIILKSNILEVIEIIKPTKSEMFGNLQIGDRIILSIPIKAAGTNRGTYASYIIAKNITTGEETSKSFNQIMPIIEHFVFKSK